MSASLVGSEMCIRDRPYVDYKKPENEKALKDWIYKHKEQFPLRIPLFIDGKEI